MSEIEKQFFETFGIEPRYEDACTVEDKYWANEELANEYGTFDQYMNCKCGDQENCTTECSCAYQKEIYPQITDRILLELICVYIGYERIYMGIFEIDHFRRFILSMLMDLYKETININKKERLKHQVQALFKEE